MSDKILLRSGILTIILIISLQKHVSAQVDTLRKNFVNERFYLQKSKQQKKLATASLVSGVVIAGVGGYLWFLAPIAGLSESGNVEGAERTGKALTIVGSGLVAVSIPLFISSNRNKTKAAMYLGSSSLLLPLSGTRSMVCIGAKISFH